MGEEQESLTIPCERCSREVSRYEDICPYCGNVFRKVRVDKDRPGH